MLCNQCEQLLLDNYELIPDTTHHVTLTTRQLCQRVNTGMSTLTQWPTRQQSTTITPNNNASRGHDDGHISVGGILVSCFNCYLSALNNSE